MAHEQAAVAKQPLFEVTEGMLNDGAAPDHHVWMGLHSLLHALKRRFMDMSREITLLGLGALGFERTACAVLSARLIDSVAAVELLELQRFAGRALITIGALVVAEGAALEVLPVSLGIFAAVAIGSSC